MSENFDTPLVAVETSVTLIQASPGKRLANYLIDLVFFYLVVAFWGVAIAIISPSTLDGIDDSPGFDFLSRIIGLILYGFVLSLAEGIFRGKSIGKFITGTKAVNEYDGSEISFSTAFARGFSRAVPFNAFSALGNPCYPWHDKWTKTIVVDERRMKEEQGYPV